MRERIRRGKGLIRKAGPDYLAYALIDALIDEFFPVLERFGEQIEELEDELILRPSPEILHRIHAVKRDLLVLRRTAWPERDAINAFSREESHLISAETKVFLRDCYDHIVQVMDMIETYRELAAGLLDVYLSSISQPDERGHEGADHHLDHLHPPDLHRRRLRHELRSRREPLEHAGARVVLRLPVLARA